MLLAFASSTAIGQDDKPKETEEQKKGREATESFHVNATHCLFSSLYKRMPFYILDFRILLFNLVFCSFRVLLTDSDLQIALGRHQHIPPF